MIYIVNGFPGSGKTTFEKYVKLLVKDNIAVYTMSTIDIVKHIAVGLGWDGVKTAADRKFLSNLKDVLTDWKDLPFENISERIRSVILCFSNPSEFIIFVDCREPIEIQKLCERFNAKSVLIRRPMVEQLTYSNHADAEVLNYTYDIIVDNDGDLGNLASAALNFLEAEGFKAKEDVEIDLFGKVVYI